MEVARILSYVVYEFLKLLHAQIRNTINELNILYNIYFVEYNKLYKVCYAYFDAENSLKRPHTT